MKSCATKVGLGTVDLKMEASNLSMGQQQLLSIARLLLYDGSNYSPRPRMIVMDEPTASVDPTTDAQIQSVIKSEFSGVTMLTIAHRLNTVIDSDRIIVMDHGRVMENGAPAELLQREGGFLRTMMMATTTADADADADSK